MTVKPSLLMDLLRFLMAAFLSCRTSCWRCFWTTNLLGKIDLHHNYHLITICGVCSLPTSLEIVDEDDGRRWPQSMIIYEAGKAYLDIAGWGVFIDDNRLCEGDRAFFVRGATGLVLRSIIRGPGKRTVSEPKLVVADTRMLTDQVVAEDITRGSELVKVPAINGYDDQIPPAFTYVASSITGRGVSLRSNPKELQSGCRCRDSCKTDCECPIAYDSEGFILPPQDRPKGPGFPGLSWKRLRSEAVMECSYMCRCGPDCINRVVQKGMVRQLEVFRCKSKGWGLRAAELIPQGAFVCEYVGELITCAEAENRGRDIENGDAYLYDLDLLAEKQDEFDVDSSSLVVIDARAYGGVARFANHACGSKGEECGSTHPCNMTKVSVFIGHRDPTQPRLCLFAQRDIAIGEELCYDYDYAIGTKVHPLTGEEVAIPCHCESPDCRQRLV